MIKKESTLLWKSIILKVKIFSIALDLVYKGINSNENLEEELKEYRL
jgi:hypothetical protein